MRRLRSEFRLLALYLALAAGVASWYVYRELMVAGGLGFPLDDSWIHQQIARNLASGQLFSFNPGEPTSAATAPLWSLLLALPYALGAHVVVAAKVLGTLSLAFASFLVDRLAFQATGSLLAARTAGCAMCMAAPLVWGAVSGMEVPLAALLVAATFLAYESLAHRSGFLWGFLAGLASGVRPEALVVWPVLFAFWVRESIPITKARVRGLAAPVVGVLVALLPLAAWNLFVHSRPWPGTLEAKAMGFGTGAWNDIVSVSTGWTAIVGNHVAFILWLRELGLGILIAMIAAVAALPGETLNHSQKRSMLMGGLIVFATLVARALVAPWPPFVVFQEHRYASYLLVPLILMASLGIAAVERQAGRHRWLAPLLAVWVIGSLATQLSAGATRHAEGVANINRVQVAMGQWVNLATSSATLVATNDIGAIGYIGRRYVIDTEGLVTASALEYRRRRDMGSFLARAKPDLLVVFPEWYPELRSQLETWPVCHVEEAEPVVAGGRRLVAHGTPWTRPGTLDCPSASSQSSLNLESR